MSAGMSTVKTLKGVTNCGASGTVFPASTKNLLKAQQSAPSEDKASGNAGKPKVIVDQTPDSPVIISSLEDLTGRKVIEEYDPAKPNIAEQDVKDQKLAMINTPIKNLLHQIKMSKGGKGKGKLGLKPVRTKMWNGGNAAGSAATQFNTVISLTPSTCGEFTQFANLYDECKVHGATLHFTILVAAASGSQPIVMHGNVVYDPIDSTAYTSLTTSLAAAQKTGLLATLGQQFGAFAAASAWSIAPVAVNRTGVHKFKFKAPKGPHAAVNGTPSGASVFYTEGLWYAVSNLTTGTDIYGYVKPYFEGVANCTFQWYYWIEYDMEFRSRT